MRFEWPSLLWLLLLLPLLGAAYWFIVNRRQPQSIVFSSLSLIEPALIEQKRWRRHVPPALLGVGLLLLIVALARPSSTFSLPTDRFTVIMAMDVSLSMRATDMKPNRITAAKEAAKAFVAELPPSINVGIVAFAGNASVVQTPTNNREDLIAAIDAFQLQRATATGSALLVALKTLLPDADIDLEAAVFNPNGKRSPAGDVADPVAPGSYKNGAILLLSDGRRTTGADPAYAAKQAADRGVKVYTVGFGSKDPNANAGDEWSFYLRLDEEALKNMAATSQGTYTHAGSAADLKRVYEGFNTKFSLERRETEVSALFTALAMLFVLIAAGLSLAWFKGR